MINSSLPICIDIGRVQGRIQWSSKWEGGLNLDRKKRTISRYMGEFFLIKISQQILGGIVPQIPHLKSAPRRVSDDRLERISDRTSSDQAPPSGARDTARRARAHGIYRCGEGNTARAVCRGIAAAVTARTCSRSTVTFAVARRMPRALLHAIRARDSQKRVGATELGRCLFALSSETFESRVRRRELTIISSVERYPWLIFLHLFFISTLLLELLRQTVVQVRFVRQRARRQRLRLLQDRRARLRPDAMAPPRPPRRSISWP